MTASFDYYKKNLSLRNKFSYKRTNLNLNAEFDETELTLPVSCVSDKTKVKVSFYDGEKWTEYTDWKITKVNRPKNKGFSDFTVTFKSKKAGDYEWSKKSKVRVEIDNRKYADMNPLVVNFKVVYDEGIIWDSVEFKKV